MRQNSSSGQPCTALTCQKRTVLSLEIVTKLTQSLDQLLVFVELLEGFHVHARDPSCIGFIAMGGITEEAHLELGTGNMAQSGREKCGKRGNDKDRPSLEQS